MSRALRHALALALVAFAFSACANSATGPRTSINMAQCDVNSSNTCK